MKESEKSEMLISFCRKLVKKEGYKLFSDCIKGGEA